MRGINPPRPPPPLCMKPCECELTTINKVIKKDFVYDNISYFDLNGTVFIVQVNKVGGVLSAYRLMYHR